MDRLSVTTLWRQATKICRRAAACVLLPGLALANDAGGALQDLASIAAAASAKAGAIAREHGYTDVQVSVRPLDERLRLAACEAPLETFSSRAGHVLGAVSIGVRCPGASPWTLYVRTHVNTRVTLAVASRSLPRGAVLARGDLHTARRDLDDAGADLVRDPGHVIGMEVIRPLTAGSPIRRNQLRAAQVIQRGQTVTLVAGSGGLRVEMRGRAMSDAAAGERLQVTNLSSGRRVEGVANRDGSVSVD